MDQTFDFEALVVFLKASQFQVIIHFFFFLIVHSVIVFKSYFSENYS